jgi:hypothetical protein
MEGCRFGWACMVKWCMGETLFVIIKHNCSCFSQFIYFGCD